MLYEPKFFPFQLLSGWVTCLNSAPPRVQVWGSISVCVLNSSLPSFLLCWYYSCSRPNSAIFVKLVRVRRHLFRAWGSLLDSVLPISALFQLYQQSPQLSVPSLPKHVWASLCLVVLSRFCWRARVRVTSLPEATWYHWIKDGWKYILILGPLPLKLLEPASLSLC